MKDYLEINKLSWDKRLDPHLASDFYDVENFKKGKSSLNQIELDLLGDLQGKSVLHLQCHFGQDTMSMSRMGASCVGVDFSDRSIDVAREMSKDLGLDTEFICTDIYSLDESMLDRKFDIVFTSYGTIGWLPDVQKWADVIGKFMKDSGHFIIADFHPTIWMFDDLIEKIEFSYFLGEPIVEEEEGSYTDKSEHIKTKCVSWNHSFSEIFNALKSNGLQMDSFHEFDYSPYSCFQNMVENTPGKFMIRGKEKMLPIVYSMKWSRRVKGTN